MAQPGHLGIGWWARAVAIGLGGLTVIHTLCKVTFRPSVVDSSALTDVNAGSSQFTPGDVSQPLHVYNPFANHIMTRVEYTLTTKDGNIFRVPAQRSTAAPIGPNDQITATPLAEQMNDLATRLLSVVEMDTKLSHAEAKRIDNVARQLLRAKPDVKDWCAQDYANPEERAAQKATLDRVQAKFESRYHVYQSRLACSSSTCARGSTSTSTATSRVPGIILSMDPSTRPITAVQERLAFPKGKLKDVYDIIANRTVKERMCVYVVDDDEDQPRDAWFGTCPEDYVGIQ